MTAIARVEAPQEQQLVSIEHARHWLAQAQSVEQVLGLRDQAAAVEHYRKVAGHATEACNEAAELKLRAERRIGELLREMPKNTGSRNLGGDTMSPPKEAPPKLSSLGIHKKQSERWQAIATLPVDVFEGHILKARQSGGQLTTASALQLAKTMDKQRQQEAARTSSAGGEKVSPLCPPVIRLDPDPARAAVQIVLAYGEEFASRLGRHLVAGQHPATVRVEESPDQTGLTLPVSSALPDETGGGRTNPDPRTSDRGTILRYPGGKARLARHILPAFGDAFSSADYREPFAGSGAVAWAVLERFKGGVARVVLNDLDSGIVALWRAVRDEPDRFAGAVRSYHPCVEDFAAFLSLDGEGGDPVTVGLRKVALHRMSYSGLGYMSGGPLGGWDQSGEHTVSSRWNGEAIARDITRISRLMRKAGAVEVTCQDFAASFAGATDRTLIYCDPPYSEAGADLYRHAFGEADHVRLCRMLRDTPARWVLSYDDRPLIRDLYGAWCEVRPVPVCYTVGPATGGRASGTEVLITPRE